MEIRTYRAANMHEALAMVRDDLGPQAAILHTREVGGRGWLRWLPGGRKIEVTASAEVNVPSRLRPVAALSSGASPSPTSPAAGVESRPLQRPPSEASSEAKASHNPPAAAGHLAAPHSPAAELAELTRREVRQELESQLGELQAMLADWKRNSQASGRAEVPAEMFHLYADLIEAEFSENLSRQLLERVRSEVPKEEVGDPLLVKARLARIIESEIAVTGPLEIEPGRRRLVALVGPTGVGKTTTIAKLAAHYRLKEKRRVGLITVDTYRIAAVEQLRTYADIIDLPMQVVSSPREMREAAARMADLDLVLMDTAGRSPRDEVKIHELKTFLAEAQADQVHLVLSAVAGASTLERTAEKFAVVGATALILTKLDEATGLGNLLPVLQKSRLPLSYLTHGQNVPDDIDAADPRKLAGQMLGLPNALPLDDQRRWSGSRAG